MSLYRYISKQELKSVVVFLVTEGHTLYTVIRGWRWAFKFRGLGYEQPVKLRQGGKILNLATQGLLHRLNRNTNMHRSPVISSHLALLVPSRDAAQLAATKQRSFRL